MSNLSNFLDVFVERLEAIYTKGNGYFLLNNVYQLQENNQELKLAKGYGFKLDAANLPATEQIGCYLELERQITVFHTRKSMVLDNDRMRFFEAEKALLEDQRLLLIELQNNWDLYYSNDNKITSLKFDGDSGILPVFDGRSDFIKIESQFILNYEEPI
jgi:hypothetical protein